MELNKKTYDDLCCRVEGNSIDYWYSKTEKVFKAQEINCEDDFLKLVAFAYSWMPTIPKWRKKLDWQVCFKGLQKLKKGEPDSLKELLLLIVPVINNSIVGASKVLHFAFPDCVPIIDRNVVKGWRRLFFNDKLPRKGKGKIAPLPADFGQFGSDDKKQQHHIELYVQYSENLVEWSENVENINIRCIETKLYLLGKKISDAKLKGTVVF